MTARIDWRTRALTAEAQLAAQDQATRAILTDMAAKQADRAALMSITSQGRTVRMSFVRNGVVTHIEFMSTWDDNIEGWRGALLNG